MKFLLDTNACISHLRSASSKIAARLRSLSPSDVAVCSIVRSELLFGAARSRDPLRERHAVEAFLRPFRSLTFDDAAADRSAQLRAALEAIGRRIGAYDVQIAGIALANGLTLVTHNVAEFSRIVGLPLEDWEAT